MVRFALLAGALCIALACDSTGKHLVIPDEMVHRPDQSRLQPPGKPTPDERYTVRLAENGRIWELQLPEDSSGYELKIPLEGGPPEQALTAADAEMIDGALPADGGVPDVHAPTHSYLAGVARVAEMYRDRRYELALIAAVELEKTYPRDARLFAMKGTLLLKLGKPKQAREAYQQALAINPNDTGVSEALRALDQEP